MDTEPTGDEYDEAPEEYYQERYRQILEDCINKKKEKSWNEYSLFRYNIDKDKET